MPTKRDSPHKRRLAKEAKLAKREDAELAVHVAQNAMGEAIAAAAAAAAAVADASMVDAGRGDELRDRLRKARIVHPVSQRDSDIGRALDTIEHMLDTIRRLMR